jgi:hypothetical protein
MTLTTAAPPCPGYIPPAHVHAPAGQIPIIQKFQAADLAGQRRSTYTGSFVVMAYRFGRIAACMLSPGVAQGAPLSPQIFGLTFDPLHSAIQESGSTLHGVIESTGSSGFADDTQLHTDCTDAVTAMAILVTKTAEYLCWAGMDIHMKKCGITAMDMRNCQRVATDSITLRGQPFPVVLPISCTRT